jgi:hypothetical protein
MRYAETGYESARSPAKNSRKGSSRMTEALNDGTGWRVMEILWQAETPDQPVSARYLP